MRPRLLSSSSSSVATDGNFYMATNGDDGPMRNAAATTRIGEEVETSDAAFLTTQKEDSMASTKTVINPQNDATTEVPKEMVVVVGTSSSLSSANSAHSLPLAQSAPARYRRLQQNEEKLPDGGGAAYNLLPSNDLHMQFRHGDFVNENRNFNNNNSNK